MYTPMLPQTALSGCSGLSRRLIARKTIRLTTNQYRVVYKEMGLEVK